MVQIRHKNRVDVLYELNCGCLSGADLRYMRLREAYLSHADLEGANLSGTDLEGALLCHSILLRAVLDEANLMSANLYCAHMGKASLCHASLEDAVLEGAILAGADLSHASLKNADARLSNLSGCNLVGVDLTKAKLQGALLEGVRFDASTQWPTGLSVDSIAGSSNRPNEITNRRSITHRLRKLKSGTIQLWTIQEAALWDRLRRHETLFVDPDFIDPVFLPAYDWMRRQMAQRLVDYQGNYPWWAWHKPKPDLRSHSRSHYPGDRQVRLELAIPVERVLLSDYASWHPVLNCRYLASSEQDAAAWDAELQVKSFNRYIWPLPEPYLSRVMASWERMFDLHGLASGGYWSTECVQASFERLDLEDVVEVTEFWTR